MSGYTKLFTTLLDSTVWALSKEARLLWITMLLKKNRDQIVECSIPGLAHAARLSVEETEVALEELGRPDPYSQTKVKDGRRIEKIDRGWLVINGELYRNLLSAEERLEYKRRKQKEYRAKKTKPLPGEEAYVRVANEHGIAAADAAMDAGRLSEATKPHSTTTGGGSSDERPATGQADGMAPP